MSAQIIPLDLYRQERLFRRARALLAESRRLLQAYRALASKVSE